MNFDVTFNEKDVELQADFDEKDVELQADFGNKIELNHLIVQSMSVDRVYAISNSSTDAPTEWEDKAITPTTDKPYLWEKTNTTYTIVDGTVYNFTDNGVVVGVHGEDGYTPVKGKDYFTNADIAEFLSQATPASHATNKNNPHGVTAEQVGARPADWMPSASDVGARPNDWMPTAEQVGARANTWLPTIAEIGAAPKGYGLGEYAPFITDANKAILPGFYRFDSSKTCANIPSEWQFLYGTMIVSRGSSYIEQLFLAREVNAKRTCSGETWGEWEYINPPMSVGVEYRTIERYNGKPVYTKLVDCGALPNNSPKTVAYNYTSSTPISIFLTTSNGAVFCGEGVDTNISATTILVSSTNYSIVLKTTTDLSSVTAKAIVKYVKD